MQLLEVRYLRSCMGCEYYCCTSWVTSYEPTRIDLLLIEEIDSRNWGSMFIAGLWRH